MRDRILKIVFDENNPNRMGPKLRICLWTAGREPP